MATLVEVHPAVKAVRPWRPSRGEDGEPPEWVIGIALDHSTRCIRHPRSYGTFPRKIGRYCLDDGVLPIEQAIRSASGLPADVLGLKDRGYLKPGQAADVVVFDPKAYRDTATFEKPHQYATGVKYLFVNGKAVIDGGSCGEVLAGKPLRKK
jgi:N-acyl-D-amino-acid deacylase